MLNFAMTLKYHEPNIETGEIQGTTYVYRCVCVWGKWMLHAKTDAKQREEKRRHNKILHIRVLISNDNGKENTKYVNIGPNEWENMFIDLLAIAWTRELPAETLSQPWAKWKDVHCSRDALLFFVFLALFLVYGGMAEHGSSKNLSTQ